MIALIISITVALAILVSAFVSFTPNLQRLMEKDFMNRAEANAFLYSLQKGQLGVRAGTLDNDPLTPTPDTFDIDTDLRTKADEDGNVLQRNWIHTDVTFQDTGIIDVELCLDETGDCPAE
jgi:hypothetical protein